MFTKALIILPRIVSQIFDVLIITSQFDPFHIYQRVTVQFIDGTKQKLTTKKRKKPKLIIRRENNQQPPQYPSKLPPILPIIYPPSSPLLSEQQQLDAGAGSTEALWVI